MSDLNQKVKVLAKRLEKINKSFDLGKKRKELKKLEIESVKQNLWDDQKHARGLMQDIGNLKGQLEQLEEVGKVVQEAQTASDLGMDKELRERVKQAEKLIKEVELATFLSGQYDRKNAVVSIHAGQGGTEAMDWTSMLYRMYLKFCERRGLKTETVDISEGEEAGIKSVTFKVEGTFAYGYLKGEAGTHRLVRQSPFNADKLRQTSFALVEVLPELEEVDLPDIDLQDDDIEWQFFRASSQGGQNVQKVSTAVRLKHIPSGIAVTAQTERYQEANRKIALTLLRAKLWALEQRRQEEKVEEIKGEYRPASWGNQIRSYVLHPYKMVKDLRTKVETSDTEAVLDGELDDFIEAELKLDEKKSNLSAN